MLIRLATTHMKYRHVEAGDLELLTVDPVLPVTYEQIIYLLYPTKQHAFDFYDIMWW